MSDIRKSKNKLTVFSLKYNVNATKATDSTVGGQKRMRVAKDENLEEAMTKWFIQQRSCGNDVRGMDIQDAATKLTNHMGILQF